MLVRRPGFIAGRTVRECGVPAVAERLRERGRAGRRHHEGPRHRSHQRFQPRRLPPVVGLRTDQLSGDYLGFARAVYYHQIGNMPLLGRGIYVGGSLKAATSGPSAAIFPPASCTVPAACSSPPTPGLTRSISRGYASGGQSSFYIFLGRI